MPPRAKTNEYLLRIATRQNLVYVSRVLTDAGIDIVSFRAVEPENKVPVEVTKRRSPKPYERKGYSETIRKKREAVVEAIVRLLSENHALTLAQIAARLNNDGVLNRYGSQWTPNSIARHYADALEAMTTPQPRISTSRKD